MITTESQKKKIPWNRYWGLLGWVFLLLFESGLVRGQTINWNSSIHPTYAEDVNEGSSESTDIYFYFEVEDASISGGRVIVTLPYGNEGFDLTRFPLEKLAGSANLGTPTVSNNVLTFSGVNLPAGSTVWYRIPRYIKTQYNGIRPESKVKIQVYRTTSVIATNGTKDDIAYNY
ncbi:MAG: hypothetical protein LBU57_07080, partial [Dysgonamonadaceae bacterium]|nr:hypothetical protein [Dysgonamonadaceae bacterium]